jgi:hypothetical protein
MTNAMNTNRSGMVYSKGVWITVEASVRNLLRTINAKRAK